jgi:hypothetical protein
MINEKEQLIVLVLSAIGIFLQTLYAGSPFNREGIVGQLKVSLNVALYYAFLTGGIVITSNIFISPLWILLQPPAGNSIIFTLLRGKPRTLVRGMDRRVPLEVPTSVGTKWGPLRKGFARFRSM